MKELNDDDRKKLRAFRKDILTCEPGDCSPQVLSAVLQCPDEVSFAGQTAECTLQDGACRYQYVESTCPSCSTDDECEGDLMCNPDGLCSV